METKSQSMQKVARGLAHEAFTHETLGTFDITLMRRAAKQGLYGEVYEAPLLPDDVAWMMKNRDWEPERIWQLVVDPKAPWDVDPAMAVLIPDGTHLLCDGIHRILARWLLKLPTFKFWMVPLDQAIRPSSDMVRQAADWGAIEIRQGKLFHRGTSTPWTGTEPPHH